MTAPVTGSRAAREAAADRPHGLCLLAWQVSYLPRTSSTLGHLGFPARCSDGNLGSSHSNATVAVLMYRDPPRGVIGADSAEIHEPLP